jgi:hypothetical protein
MGADAVEQFRRCRHHRRTPSVSNIGRDAVEQRVGWRARIVVELDPQRGSGHLPPDPLGRVGEPDHIGHSPTGCPNGSRRARLGQVAIRHDENGRRIEKIAAVLAATQIRVHGHSPCESDTEHGRDNAQCGEKSGHFHVQIGPKANTSVTSQRIVSRA